jgi:hypothetical protein
MLKLEIVESAIHEAENPDADSASDAIPLSQGERVLKELVLPWERSNRIVSADSYFVSVPAAFELKRIGLNFIGEVL